MLKNSLIVALILLLIALGIAYIRDHGKPLGVFDGAKTSYAKHGDQQFNVTGEIVVDKTMSYLDFAKLAIQKNDEKNTAEVKMLTVEVLQLAEKKIPVVLCLVSIDGIDGMVKVVLQEFTPGRRTWMFCKDVRSLHE